jgi:hypothetical protein
VQVVARDRGARRAGELDAVGDSIQLGQSGVADLVAADREVAGRVGTDALLRGAVDLEALDKENLGG